MSVFRHTDKWCFCRFEFKFVQQLVSTLLTVSKLCLGKTGTPSYLSAKLFV